MALCFVDPADAIRAISDSIGREARRQLLGEAVRAWGDGSRAFEAVAYLANSKQASHLARALERYDAAIAAMDESEAPAIDRQAAE